MTIYMKDIINGLLCKYYTKCNKIYANGYCIKYDKYCNKKYEGNYVKGKTIFRGPPK